MKKFFGEYHYLLKKAAKRLGVSVEDVFQSIPAPIKGDVESVTSFAHAQAELKCLQGKGIHYFIESEDLTEKLIEWGTKWDSRVIQMLVEDGMVCGTIHTCGKNAAGILFHYVKSYDYVVLADGSYRYVAKQGSKGAYDVPVLVFLGLALYKNAFPMALRDGFPDCGKHPSHYRRLKCFGVRKVEQIMDRSGPVPHFRSGHFRVLASPRFTNKRWQAVFVSECFVKGKVKTVTEMDIPCNS